MENTENTIKDTESAKELTARHLECGKVCFCLGKYNEAIDNLTKCIPYRHDRSCAANVINAYIQLGLVYCLLGYEIAAAENFMLGQEYARQRGEHGLASDCLIQLSWIYRILGDYEKAIDNSSSSEIEAEQTVGEERVRRICRAKICKAQILCFQEEYEGAMKLRDETKKLGGEVGSGGSKSTECSLSLDEIIMDIFLEDYLRNEALVNQKLLGVLEMAQQETDFISRYSSYIEVCQFALERGKKQPCRVLLDCLHERAHDAGALYIRLKVQTLEVKYRRKYCPQAVYYQACLEYWIMQQKNEADTREMKRGSLENIEKLRAEEEEKRLFEYKSRCDLMTGLLNKNAAEEEIRRYLNNRAGNSLDAMIMIDVDHFKGVNDQYGHLMGDQVIVFLAELIKKIFTERQILGRFGGDEFMVFVKEAQSREELEQSIYQLKDTFANQPYSDGELTVTISIGASYITDMTVSYEAIFSCADEALYKAKEYGRNMAAFYEINGNRLHCKKK